MPFADDLAQAAKPDSTVFAVVRNAAKSTHLQAAIRSLNNVRIVEADVGDHASLQVPSFLTFPFLLPGVADTCFFSQNAAKEISRVTGGKLDCLIHNAARMDPAVMPKGFDQ